ALYGASPEAAPTVKKLFFQGEPESMRFVSTYSLQEASRGRPRILEFQVIPGEQAKGVRLVVNEILYTGPASAGFFCVGPASDHFLFRRIEIGPQSFVLGDKLAFCRFSYQDSPPAPAPPEWRPMWTEERWPSAIRIDMGPLADDVVRLRPLP